MSDYPKWLQKAADSMGRRGLDSRAKAIHVTTLLKPPHMVRLEDRYHDAIEQDAGDLIPAMVGIAWHEYVANLNWDVGRTGYTERRYEKTCGEWTITGTPDWHDEHTIVDHKTTRMWSYVFGKREWEEQLNIYRWLLYPNLQIDRLEIHAVYLDWSEQQVRANSDLPRKRFQVVPVRLWPIEDTASFIEGRLKAIDEWSQHCTAEERWERGECWAVMKKGRKRAVARCATQHEAEAAVAREDDPSLWIEHRPGDPIRCRSYCAVKSHCSFGREVNGGLRR